MAFQRDPLLGRNAVAWFAVTFTMTVGTVVCSFIILACADNPRQGFAVLGGVLALILVFLWSISNPKDKQPSRTWLQFWRSTQEPPDPAELYQPKRRRRKGTPLGSNQPPSLEAVKEIAERHARWVPHGPPPKRDRPDRP